MNPEEEELDEWACRAFNPDDHIHVELTWWAEDGSTRTGYASVAPGTGPETLAALTRLLQAAERSLIADRR